MTEPSKDLYINFLVLLRTKTNLTYKFPCHLPSRVVCFSLWFLLGLHVQGPHFRFHPGSSWGHKTTDYQDLGVRKRKFQLYTVKVQLRRWYFSQDWKEVRVSHMDIWGKSEEGWVLRLNEITKELRKNKEERASWPWDPSHFGNEEESTTGSWDGAASGRKPGGCQYSKNQEKEFQVGENNELTKAASPSSKMMTEHWPLELQQEGLWWPWQD